MLKILNNFDRFVHRILEAMCSLFLALMVGFTIYNVVMRYVFANPPVWGDLLTVLSNIWLMFIALSLTARDNEHIALNLIYEKLPSRLALYIRQFWKLMIIVIGIVLIIYGFELVEVCGVNIGKCGILNLQLRVLNLKKITCQKNMLLLSCL